MLGWGWGWGWGGLVHYCPLNVFLRINSLRVLGQNDQLAVCIESQVFGVGLALVGGEEQVKNGDGG